MQPRLSVREYGDSGLLVDVVHDDYETRWSTTQAVRALLEAARPVGLLDVVATFDSLFVSFDPYVTHHADLTAVVEDAGRRAAVRSMVASSRVFRVPTSYGAEDGPDLQEVAAELGMSGDELVDRHSSTIWRVRFRAAPVGAPFLDGPSWPHRVPRLAAPRTRVAPGSVAVSGQQCVIYPVASPGGWRLIGRTPSTLVDPTSDELVVYRPGDSFRFVPVDPHEFARLSATAEGLYAEALA